MVFILLVPPLHPVPCLVYQVGVRGKECLNIHPGHLHLVLEVRLEARPDLSPQATEESLVMCGVICKNNLVSKILIVELGYVDINVEFSLLSHYLSRS